MPNWPSAPFVTEKKGSRPPPGSGEGGTTVRTMSPSWNRNDFAATADAGAVDPRTAAPINAATAMNLRIPHHLRLARGASSRSYPPPRELSAEGDYERRNSCHPRQGLTGRACVVDQKGSRTIIATYLGSCAPAFAIQS